MGSVEYTSTATTESNSHSLSDPERRKRHDDTDFGKRKVIIWSLAAIAVIGIIIGFAAGFSSGESKHQAQEGDESESAATGSDPSSGGSGAGGEDLDFGSGSSGGISNQQQSSPSDLWSYDVESASYEQQLSTDMSSFVESVSYFVESVSYNQQSATYDPTSIPAPTNTPTPSPSVESITGNDPTSISTATITPTPPPSVESIDDGPTSIPTATSTSTEPTPSPTVKSIDGGKQEDAGMNSFYLDDSYLYSTSFFELSQSTSYAGAENVRRHRRKVYRNRRVRRTHGRT